MQLERRNFIKESCKLCASITGVALLLKSLDSCSPLHYFESEIVENSIRVPFSQFLEGSNLVIVKNVKLEYDIAVVKNENQFYKAFELKCTHQANALIATKTGFFCNLHGSSYDINGKVINTPATTNLKEYLVSINSEMITIQL